MASFPKPTDEELKKIKKLLLDPEGVPDEVLGVVRQLMADNNVTSYGTVLSKPILENFVKNLTKPEGTHFIPLMFSHPSLGEMLPLGTAFDGELKEVPDETNELGEPLLELYGSFYTVDGKEVVSFGGGGLFGGSSATVIETKDIGLKYKAGQIRAGSIGFKTELAMCNVCDSQYRRGDCDHRIGEKYDGTVCRVIMGVSSKDSKKSDGGLREYSVLLAGAVKQAGAVEQYSYSEPSEEGYTYEFDSQPAEVRRLTDEGYDTNNKRTESSTQTPQKETYMPEIKLEIEKYEELVENKIKLAIANGTVEELSAEVKELRSKVEEVSDIQTKLTDTEAANEELLAIQKSFVDIVVASGIKAFGQDEDDNADKYASMSVDELATAFESNVETYFQALAPGEHSQTQPIDPVPNRYNKARAFVKNMA